ncbi:hypothetical protein A2159_02570 [Candidatus Woesebacteria bacterium RBG_13_34_9]|uniref:Uncharacterized protein n=1 Tax=Candidatus Woesebacteria bacterium RBG_13_34_9 TaxID=1802477 RepID=A0A1F7X2A8_9BACT|nr:MAG: hypothetical protein A2159_02570 [Candidatus Woesebacteria bacterium RBG_13_34_9]
MKKVFIQQFIPVSLTIVTFLVLSTCLYGLLLILNSLPLSEKITLDFRKRDILVGIVIYLKTAIDFAIFIGNLMHTNPGWKKRIAIEMGTAIGNAFGTFLILIVWVIFKEVPLLMMAMIFIASIVLLRMAEESLEEFLKQKKSFISIDIRKPVSLLQEQLNLINKLFRPILRFFVPNLSLTRVKKLSFANLVVFSFTIPFILGLDDFAGYIPLFSVINLFGFALGVMLGHMLLNVGLFIWPKMTVRAVKHPIVLIVGGLAFIGLALWGFWESIHLLLEII